MVLLPFALPHKGLQNLRRKLFYWRVVYNYRLMNGAGALTGDKVTYKFLRFVLFVGAFKLVENGVGERQDEWLKQYNARKANIETAEKAMWDEELALHAVDPRVAEAAVYRQRELDWKFRAQPGAHARAMMEMQFPFIGKMREMK